MPNPVPITILARLAVDKRFKGRGLGPALLKDAIQRTLQVSDYVGTAALLVHALHEEAESFYRHMGFKPSRVTPLTLMLPLKEIQHNARG
jgi:GNAT superfamily N-acetyltransferase